MEGSRILRNVPKKILETEFKKTFSQGTSKKLHVNILDIIHIQEHFTIPNPLYIWQDFHHSLKRKNSYKQLKPFYVQLECSLYQYSSCNTILFQVLLSHFTLPNQKSKQHTLPLSHFMLRDQNLAFTQEVEKELNANTFALEHFQSHDNHHPTQCQMVSYQLESINIPFGSTFACKNMTQRITMPKSIYTGKGKICQC